MLDLKNLLWLAPEELTDQEQKIVARAKKTRKLYVFLRAQRHRLFEEDFQRELMEMYRQTGAGKAPLAPARLAMLTLLQAYNGESDNETIELTVDSKRWQMVLDCLGSDEALCSQKTLWDFRMRLMLTGMDKRLLERTVDIARSQGGFCAKALKAALDSSPLWGHGRVEDTINLIAHGTHNVLEAVAALRESQVNELIEAIGLTLLGRSSIKAALDIDWTDEAQKYQALQRLYREVELVRQWIRAHWADSTEPEPLAWALATLERVLAQDLEPDVNGQLN